MLVALAALTLASAQLGWRAGTPEPVLDANPKWVELYWKAWENLHAATVEEKEPGPWPSRAFAQGGFIGFDETLAISLYACWGWRAHPARETLSYVMQGVGEEGGAPARFGSAGTSGTATGLPIASLAAERVYRFSNDHASLTNHLAGAQRRHSFFSSRYAYTVPPAAEKEEARNAYRVPVELSNLPLPVEAPGEDSAEALGLLLQESAMLARLYSAAGNSRSAGTTDRLTAGIAKRLAALWSNDDRRFRGAAEGAIERDSIMPLLGGIGGKMPYARNALQGLFDPSRYYRRTLFPTVPRTDPAYNGAMGTRPLYTYLALRSLIDSGMRKEAGRVAENILSVYESAAGTGLDLFGAYGPETRTPPQGASPGSLEAGTIAISGLIEAVIGIDVDAKANRITWHLRRQDRHGIKNLRFGDNVVTMIWENGTISTECEKPFTLEATTGTAQHSRKFAAGKSEWKPGDNG